MDHLTDFFKDKQVKKALFTDDVLPEEEDTFDINSWKTMRKSLSCGDISDNDFYPAEVGKEMILRDQAQAAQSDMLQNVTSCSSWAINSQQHFPEGFEKTVERQCKGLFLGYEDIPKCSFVSSTPVSNGSFLFPTTTVVSKTKEHDCENHLVRRDSSLFPMLLLAAPNGFNAPSVVKMKKTRTFDVEEMSEDPSRPSCSSKGISRFQSLDTLGYEDTTLKMTLKKTSTRSLNGEDLWTVEPRALELDVNGKGRLILINKSNRNLKFKIVFDVKRINVGPQSGNLRSKSQLGLRVIASRCNNEKQNEIVEDIITVTCGNEEKSIPIKLKKIKKINYVKDRSFKCF